MYYFPNSSYFLMGLGDQGTLVDLVVAYNRKGGKIDETLVLFYTAEILRLVSTLHNIQVIHGDISPENCLLVSEASQRVEFTKGGWPSKVYTILFICINIY
jgi:checkpoint serine/threonine-protein kinase